MPHTLLLADDSVTIQRVVELTFADEDIRVVAVSDGDQAIAAVNQNPPDIVLADIAMPGRNGYDVALHIRSTPRLAHIPVLLLTGAFEPVDQARAQQAGCDGVLAKPFEPQLVIGRVKELLGRPRDQARPVPASASPDPVAAASSEQSGAWSNPFGEAAPAPGPKTQTLDEVSSYFDKLDEAFASIAGSPATQPAPAGGGATDWFGGGKQHEGVAPDLPLSYASPQPAFETASASADVSSRVSALPLVAPPAMAPPLVAPRLADPEPVAVRATQPGSQPVATSSTAAPRFPALVHAFEALLTAEQSGAAPTDAPTWPASASGAGTGEMPPRDNDAIVEQVARRVLEQLSDRVVRDTVADIVSQVAERLIREEIERIKARIK